MDSERLTKFSLRLFIASIVATAVLGLYALAIPSDNWEFEIKAILTTVIITGASICGLACGGCLRRGHRVLPTAGLVSTPIAAALLLFGIWVEVDSELYWKTTATLSFYAVACAHLSMLFMANLAGGYRWAYLVAYQLVFGLATLLAAGVVFDLLEGDRYWRATAGISILVAAVTLLIPVFHYMSREIVAAAEAEADPLFAVEEEMARVKKQLMELELRRRVLLGRETAGVAMRAEDDPAR
jgi:hypothetical protein